MSLANLRKDRVLRRAVEIRGKRIVIWYRWSGTSERWETAAAPARTRRRLLRWKPLSLVLWDAYRLDTTGEQMRFDPRPLEVRRG
jgi:hypothetical protein